MKVLLGVGGGIAAYKAAELARALQERGAAVQVIMTAAAQEFVRPLTFAALTGHKVITGLFASRSADEVLSSSVEHISVAQEHEILVIAPATADLIAKLAHGLAGDFLTTCYLAFTGPVVLAPAMNTNMWNHPATRANLETLRARGHHIIDPEEGELACGMVGPGRLAEPERIAAFVVSLATRLKTGDSRHVSSEVGNTATDSLGAEETRRLSPVFTTRRDFDGETVLITAGPTQEPIDPVRYISNRSSGKMGYALAEAALARGARVVLVTGPVSLAPPSGARVVRVETAAEMYKAVMEHLEEASIIIKSAAVADYHVANPAPQKLKKTGMRVSLELDPTPDILADIGKKKGGRLLIGFAAETENLLDEARSKLEKKNADMIVANLVNQQGTGFGSDQNEVVLVPRTGSPVEVPRTSKRDVADRILDQALRLRLSLYASR